MAILIAIGVSAISIGGYFYSTTEPKQTLNKQSQSPDEKKYFDIHKSKMEDVLNEMLSKMEKIEMKEMKSIEGICVQFTHGLNLKRTSHGKERKDYFLYAIEKLGPRARDKLRHIVLVRKTDQWKLIMKEIVKRKRTH